MSFFPPIIPRGLLPRAPGLRTFMPRFSVVSRPILPLTSRLATSSLFLRLINNPPRFVSSSLFHHSPARRNSPPSLSSPGSPIGPGPDATIFQRLKHLIKMYGWYALGVHLILSALDFSVAFAAINLFGADEVSRTAQSVKNSLASLIHLNPSEPGKEEVETVPQGDQEGLYAILVLAYMVHKTLFLPVRVGLTAALTPKLVGWLSRRGWAGGEGAKRAAREVRDRVRHSTSQA